MLRVKMFDIAAILLLPPLICQLSNCSASINGGLPGKAAVKKVIVGPSLDYPPSCGFSFFSCDHSHKQKLSLTITVKGCQSSALRLIVWLSWMILIFPCFSSISVSFRHFGQYRGKFFNSVSSRILILVLLPQRGQYIQSIVNLHPLILAFLTTCDKGSRPLLLARKRLLLLGSLQ